MSVTAHHVKFNIGTLWPWAAMSDERQCRHFVFVFKQVQGGRSQRLLNLQPQRVGNAAAAAASPATSCCRAGALGSRRAGIC